MLLCPNKIWRRGARQVGRRLDVAPRPNVCVLCGDVVVMWLTSYFCMSMRWSGMTEVAQGATGVVVHGARQVVVLCAEGVVCSVWAER